jgi:hypothetical protein
MKREAQPRMRRSSRSAWLVLNTRRKKLAVRSQARVRTNAVWDQLPFPGWMVCTSRIWMEALRQAAAVSVMYRALVWPGGKTFSLCTATGWPGRQHWKVLPLPWRGLPLRLAS